MTTPNRPTHIRLTSHPEPRPHMFRVAWGSAAPADRGPIVASVTRAADRNAIGTHGGSYSIYRALAVSSGAMSGSQRPDLENTEPVVDIGPYPQWGDPEKIVSLDPWGHLPQVVFRDAIAEGIDVRPSIAITKARLNMPELVGLMGEKKLKPDGKVLKENGDISVIKAAIDPVWWLPGIARRFGVTESQLRRSLFEQTGGMYPELMTRPDLDVFLPPIGGMTVYIFGEAKDLANPRKRLTCRVHDECNGSDVFGSDICTCRPYLVHGIEECVKEAQKGGVGLIVYNRKEGRALGEVTKFLVYNARKRQEGGDQASTYFARTECVAGVQDARFQQLMPDVLNWLGITKIHRFVSMSNMKHDAVVESGIEIVERVPIPDDRVPPDASVEMEAKKAAGYYAPEGHKDLGSVVGRDLDKM